jgi:hypothetical protein
VRRLVALLPAAFLAGCVTGASAARDDYYCQSLEPAPPGQLTADVTLSPGHPARDYRMRWETRHGQPGARIGIETWTGSQPAAPGAHTPVIVIFGASAGLTATTQRLELRSRASSRTIARSDWTAPGRPPPVLVTQWGRLRDEMAQGPGGVEAVVIDRSGRILARDTLPPETGEAPSLGAEAARRRWAGVTGSPTGACPEGTTQMQLVVVASG